jgi:hypothetical protein
MNNKPKLPMPGWPWELELLTLLMFVIALMVPMYLNELSVSQNAQSGPATTDLKTQFGFLVSLGIVALYIFHIAFTVMETNRATASPLHLISPCLFALIAHYRIGRAPGIEESALNMVNTSIAQAFLVLVAIALITSVMARLRTYRYLTRVDDIPWAVATPSVYDSSYIALLLQLRPLLYAPRRYRACEDGILIEGWFYALPVHFDSIHSISRLAHSGITGAGFYFASSTHSLVRMELHNSIKAMYISPADRDALVRFCAQHLIRKRASHKANPTRHGVLHASDTHAAEYAAHHHETASGSKPGTRHGTTPGSAD